MAAETVRIFYLGFYAMVNLAINQSCVREMWDGKLAQSYIRIWKYCFLVQQIRTWLLCESWRLYPANLIYRVYLRKIFLFYWARKQNIYRISFIIATWRRKNLVFVASLQNTPGNIHRLSERDATVWKYS